MNRRPRTGPSGAECGIDNYEQSVGGCESSRQYVFAAPLPTSIKAMAKLRKVRPREHYPDPWRRVVHDGAGSRSLRMPTIRPVIENANSVRAPWEQAALRLVSALAACLMALSAAAQRAEQNVVTSADDAFGTSVGDQTIGLYSRKDARGFSPQQAGNLRIESLYFDEPTQYLASCMVRELTMRIGIAAQSYSFPSPTGIADIKLPVPGDTPALSGYASRASFAESTGVVEGQARLSPSLAVYGCVGGEKNFFRDEAGRSSNEHAASVLRWRPTERIEILPFASLQTGADQEVVPVVYTDGILPPPRFESRQLATQPFTTQGWRTKTLGSIVRYASDAGWKMALGVFRVIEQDPRTFEDEYLSVLPNRTADHTVDVTPRYSSASTSGEMRLARRSGGATHERTLELAIRGRRANREYGGDALVDYGVIGIDSATPIAPAPYLTSASSIDETRQVDAGVLYEERWRGKGSLAIGMLRSSYQRTIVAPGAVPETDKAEPWLGSLRFTADPAAGMTVYGSFVQGLEDSALAPYTAANRGQPPAATRTHQTDGGVRLAPTDKVSVVFGAFEIDKAYLNLDAANVYTVLGSIRHRGLESSMTYAHEGLKLVAGGVLLRPRVERNLLEPGATGLVPIGPVPLTLTINADYAPGRWHPWAASLQWNYLSARVVTSDDRYWLPQFTTISAGVRYESTIWNHPFRVRFDTVNLTDARGLRVTSLNLLMPDLGRRVTLSLAVDR
jgi:iron complex outermembrane receptor protein